MVRKLGCIIVLFFAFVFVLAPLNLRHFSAADVLAEEEYYPWDIFEDTTRGSEYATIADEVYVYNGATLTMEKGNHDFQNFINISDSNSKIIFEEGNYIFDGDISASGTGSKVVFEAGTHVFEGDISVSDNAEFVFKKGNYTFKKDVNFQDGAKFTIEKGVNIKFKKTSNYTPTLSVYGGIVSAFGTKEERITFSPADDASNDYQIFISGYVKDSTSVFDYVDFIGGGKYWEGIPQASIFDMLIKTVHAETMMNGSPTLSVISGMVQISNSKFSKSNYCPVSNSVYIDNYGVLNPSFLKISDTDFVDNARHLAVNSEMNCSYNANACYTRVTLENNWYGSADGPRTDDNPERDGDLVSGPAAVNGWSSEMHFPEIDPNAASNVLFLPGLEASRLYAKDNPSCLFINCENQLWEPNRNDDVEKLYLDKDGKSTDKYDIYTRDVLDEANILPIGQENYYKSFIGKMNDLKNKDKTINDWSAAAYDWRLSLDDILASGKKDGENISYNKETSSPYILSELRRLAVSSKSGKVTIIAHSNGGLVAKALLQKIGDEETKKLVDKIILVAVPQVGTPSAIAGLLHGQDQRLLPVLNTKTARGFGENMPGAYNLLPSKEYFSIVQTPVVEFKTEQSPEWKDLFETQINSESGLQKFLTDDFRRVSSTDSDVNTPAILNEELLDKAEDVHGKLDDWTAPEGVKVIQIAGWGVPDTLSSTEYGIQEKNTCDGFLCQFGVDYLKPDFKFTIDGDGTVVTPSALWMDGVGMYWVNIAKYNKDNPFETVGGLFTLGHANILEIPQLRTFIEDIVINKIKETSNYEYFSAEVPSASNEKRLQYSLHSPLTLELIDDQGRRTGVNADGQIEEQIPGTYFKQFGDVKYIFADEDISSHIEMRGYDNGTFTFAIEEFKGDESLGKVAFKDMPTTPETKVTFEVANNLQSASNLEIDKDGDGTNDFIFEPKIGEVVEFDLVAPNTIPSVNGKSGDNNWYVSDTVLTLTAEDNEGGSGMAKTEYSMDGGNTFITYADPITFAQEGIFDVSYRSVDKQGNVEEIKTVTIKIDKTAPEAKMIFNSTTQKLDIVGVDNFSENVSVATTEQTIFTDNHQNDQKNKFWFRGWFQKPKEKKIIVMTTLTDEAGHKTELVWEKKKFKDRRIDLAISSISYDGVKRDLSSTKLQYKWIQDWWRRRYVLFASHLSNDSISIESHYLPKQNQTWLMEKPKEIADDDSDDNAEKRPVRKKLPGMIIPGIMTEKGMAKIIY